MGKNTDGGLFRSAAVNWSAGILLVLVIILGLYNPGAFIQRFEGKIWWTFHHNQSAIVEALVTEGTSLMDGNANWKNQEKGRTVYYRLKTANDKLLKKTFSAHILQPQNRMETLYLAVKLGIPQVNAVLVDILTNKGDAKMAEDFMNCGSEEFRAAAQKWASGHGDVIHENTGSLHITPGSF